MAFEAHPLLVYLDENFQVSDLAALVAVADGFLLRGVKNVYDTKVRPGEQTLNSDAWKAEADAMRPDNSYFGFYDQIRKLAPTKPIYMVVEGNPAVDRQDYERSDAIGLTQLNMVRQVVQTNRYVPDAFIVKIVDYQWWENGKIVTCTDSNFAKCYNFFLDQLYKKYRKPIECWSSAHWIKTYRNSFGLTMDTWNNPAFGGPHYPFCFSWYPASVPNGRTLADPKQMLAELQDPVQTITDEKSPYYGQTYKTAYLTVGTYTGFQLPGSNCFALWGFDQNNFFAGVTNTSGQPKALEVFTHGLELHDWKEYMGFLASEPPPDDTQAPTAPTGLTGTVVNSGDQIGVSLTWSVSQDNVGVMGYRVYRGPTKIGEVAKPSFTDGSVVAGVTYAYAVSAFDAAGNESSESASIFVAVPGTPPPPPPPDGDTLAKIAQDVAAIRASTDALVATLRAIFRAPGE